MAWNALPTTAEFDTGLLARLIGCIGSNGFGRPLLDIMSEIAPVAEVSGLVMGQDMVPKAVGWCGRRADTLVRVERYVEEFYRFDPSLRGLPQSIASGQAWLGVFGPNCITHDEYRWMCFDTPNFRKKLSIACRRDLGWAVLNLYFTPAALPEGAAVHLGHLAALFIGPLAQSALAGDAVKQLPPVRQWSEEHLMDRLFHSFPGLTIRERQVCAGTILGKSSERIAEDLEIGQSTILTYRRRAYQKLGVNCASALAVQLL